MENGIKKSKFKIQKNENEKRERQEVLRNVKCSMLNEINKYELHLREFIF